MLRVLDQATAMAIVTGCPSGQVLGCNRDGCGSSGLSSLTIELTAGIAYGLIIGLDSSVDAWSNTPITLSITVSPYREARG
jgi:hypothetical protein